MILIVTLACVGLLVGVKFIYDPAKAKLDDMDAERTHLKGKLDEARLLMDNQRRMLPRWTALMSDGLQDGSQVESRVSKALTDWAARARLSLSSIKPDRGVREKGLQEMIFTVAGRGSLDAVTQFLWNIETAALPVKIKSMQIGSSSDAGESMSIQLYLSALYLEAPQRQPAPKAPEANHEEDI
jgi:hypothetical protein